MQGQEGWVFLQQLPSLVPGLLLGSVNVNSQEFLACCVLGEQTAVARESLQEKGCQWWHWEVELVNTERGSPGKIWVCTSSIHQGAIHRCHTTAIITMCEFRHSVVRYLDYF